jgi:broad specificity phosphatase PhoE
MWEAGPRSITLVRHGQSVANVAEDHARVSGAHYLDLRARDADVGLSPTGRRQARALGEWVAAAPEHWRPTTVFSSPYRRTLQTAEPTLRALDLGALTDERLRERDLGIFDGVTRAGMMARCPAEAKRRAELGKFYYRPPGGESWADVILRVRSFLSDLRSGYPDERVWIIAHSATIMAFRAALERLSESQLLLIDGATPLTNASLTRYVRDEDRYVLDTYADRRALEVLVGTDADRTTLERAALGGGGVDDTR